jgi:microcystin degradation protein MlrC
MKRRSLLAGAGAVAVAAAQKRKMVALGGIMHESLSFNPSLTRRAEFAVRRTEPRLQALAEWAKNQDEVAGCIEEAARADFDLTPVLFAHATPKGPVEKQAFEELTTELIRQMKAMPQLDGVLLCNHGAMVAEHFPQGDEEIIRRIREAIGPKVPFVVSHDFHANISEQTIRYCDVLLAYKENPHLDTVQRGHQAARIMGGILRGEFKPKMAIVKPPMLWNISYQNTYREPLKPIVDAAKEMEKNPKILAATVACGYQYADVPAMGVTAIVVTNNDEQLAKAEAARLGDMLWRRRDSTILNVEDVPAAVQRAMKATKYPVGLIDMGDNIGGGSAGDSTFLLAELMKAGAQGWTVVLCDPAAVTAAVKAGIGGAFEMPVGGKTDRMHGEPVRVKGRVKSLHDGSYIEEKARHGGGRYFNMGLSAVVQAEGGTADVQNLLLLTTERSSPNSIEMMVQCGIYPHRQRFFVIKGAIAPRAAYEPVTAELIPVDSPGLTAVNPRRFEFTRARKGLFGL